MGRALAGGCTTRDQPLGPGLRPPPHRRQRRRGRGCGRHGATGHVLGRVLSPGGPRQRLGLVLLPRHQRELEPGGAPGVGRNPVGRCRRGHPVRGAFDLPARALHRRALRPARHRKRRVDGRLHRPLRRFRLLRALDPGRRRGDRGDQPGRGPVLPAVHDPAVRLPRRGGARRRERRRTGRLGPAPGHDHLDQHRLGHPGRKPGRRAPVHLGAQHRPAPPGRRDRGRKGRLRLQAGARTTSSTTTSFGPAGM